LNFIEQDITVLVLKLNYHFM